MMEMRRGRIVHEIPGRVRIRVNRGELTDGSVRELEAGLAALGGFQRVQVSPSTGSVLISYNPVEVELPVLLERLRLAGLLDVTVLDPNVPLPKEVPVSLSAQRVQHALNNADVRVSQLTGGRWDLRSIMPLVLGALALRQLLTGAGQITAAPWYVLAWYAFDSFLKLNQFVPKLDESAQAPETRRRNQ